MDKGSVSMKFVADSKSDDQDEGVIKSINTNIFKINDDLIKNQDAESQNKNAKPQNAEKQNLKVSSVPKSIPTEKHPLSRSSSGSSSSSIEKEENLDKYFNQTKSSTSPKLVNKPVSKRFRDFITKYDDSSQSESPSGGGYYQTASALWHNRGKIYTDLKKQASGVRLLPQSSSLDTGHSRGLLYSKLSTNVDESVVKSLSPSNDETSKSLTSQRSLGLVKVDSDDITESKEDTEVSSFLHGFKEKVSDPLNVLLKKKEEEDKEKEDLDIDQEFLSLPRQRSATGPVARRRKSLPKQGDITASAWTDFNSYKKSFAVSLSALLAGKPKVDEDAETCNISTVSTEAMFGDKDNNGEAPVSENTTNIDEKSETKQPPSFEETTDSGPSYLFILLCTSLVFAYIMFPISPYVDICVTSFLTGCLFMAVWLCMVAPRSRRPPLLPPIVINKNVPSSVPKSLYDPHHPIKGWMNELASYDPETYHVSNTQTVFVTLDGSTMRLQTPSKFIPRRSVYNEGNIPITNVVHQRLYDVTFAKVYLKPPGLVKKRVWSKKYPICVEIPLEGQQKQTPDNSERSEVSCDDATAEKPPQATECLYLFGRTDRQKEEWFYRIQRCINVSLLLHNKNTKKSQKQSSPSTITDDFENEWGIIENHYEEETYLASSVYDVTKTNEQPVRAFQDYFVHISRLLPEVTSSSDVTNKRQLQASAVPTPDITENTENVLSEPALEVSWLNVMLGRVMFDFLRQPSWSKWVSVKIQKKLDKIKLPYFIDELKLTEMDLGSSVPLIHQISLPKLDSQGVWMDVEVSYTGSVQMTLKTKIVLTKLGKTELVLVERHNAEQSSAITDSDAEDSAESSDDDESAVSRLVSQAQNAVSKLDGQLFKDAIKHVANERPSLFQPTSTPTGLSPAPAPPKKWVRIVDSITKSKYFQKATENEYIRKKLETVSNTPMLLTVELLQLKGVLAVNIPPPPSDRIWYGFREPPVILLKVYPKVGERVVKTTHVTDWIESKLQQEFIKLLVIPNMDDIPIPIMYNNRPTS